MTGLLLGGGPAELQVHAAASAARSRATASWRCLQACHHTLGIFIAALHHVPSS